MTRQEAVDRLCDVYAGSYDVTRCEENEHALAATMDFYATAEKYVLSKKAKLWQANSFEYVYLFNVPHLTKEIYERCEKLAYEQGMAYWGWMDFHTGLVVLPEEKISTNASGHSAAQVFERGLFHKQKKSLFRKERAV